MPVQTGRAKFYRLLGRLYLSEVDRPLLAELAQLSFPAQSGEADLDAGLASLQSCLTALDPLDLAELAADFAQVFLGAGQARGTEASAFPYASVYTSPMRIMMQEARDRAVATYADYGLQLDSRQFNVPEDHLALLLEFMADLCEQPDAGAQKNLDFLEQHLLNWIFAFGADLQRFARTAFYRSLGQITCGWLRLDSAFLRDQAVCERGGKSHELSDQL